MRITDITWTPYRIPFRRPFATAHGMLTAREGIIVAMLAEDGFTGYGDAAAVTEFGVPDAPALAKSLAQIAGDLLSLSIHDIQSLLIDAEERQKGVFVHVPAPLRFAIDTASWDLIHQTSPSMLEQYRMDMVRSHSVPVNAVIGAPYMWDAQQAAIDCISQGYRTIKLKVGMMHEPREELERIKAVHEVTSSIGAALRLDANEAWTLDEASAILEACQAFDLQYIEQPLPRHDLAGMRVLRERFGIPIAADEALTDLASVHRVIDAKAADVLVLKPQMLGSLDTILDALEVGERNGRQNIITASLDSGIGVAATLDFLASYPFITLACGLATLDLLEDDLIVEPLVVSDGYMNAPAGPGLGVTLDRAALARYAIT